MRSINIASFIKGTGASPLIFHVEGGNRKSNIPVKWFKFVTFQTEKTKLCVLAYSCIHQLR